MRSPRWWPRHHILWPQYRHLSDGGRGGVGAARRDPEHGSKPEDHTKSLPALPDGREAEISDPSQLGETRNCEDRGAPDTIGEGTECDGAGGGTGVLEAHHVAEPSRERVGQTVCILLVSFCLECLSSTRNFAKADWQLQARRSKPGLAKGSCDHVRRECTTREAIEHSRPNRRQGHQLRRPRPP